MYIIIVDLTKYDYHRVFTGADEHHIFVFGASQIVCKYALQCNTIKIEIASNSRNASTSTCLQGNVCFRCKHYNN